MISPLFSSHILTRLHQHVGNLAIAVTFPSIQYLLFLFVPSFNLFIYFIATFTTIHTISTWPWLLIMMSMIFVHVANDISGSNFSFHSCASHTTSWINQARKTSHQRIKERGGPMFPKCFYCIQLLFIKHIICLSEADLVRGCSVLSDVSSNKCSVPSDNTLLPLYIPPHCCQLKTECTYGSDSRVWWTHDVDTFCILITFFTIPHFFIILLFQLQFLVYRHAPHLGRTPSFLLGSPARCAFLSYYVYILFRIPC